MCFSNSLQPSAYQPSRGRIAAFSQRISPNARLPGALRMDLYRRGGRPHHGGVPCLPGIPEHLRGHADRPGGLFLRRPVLLLSGTVEGAASAQALHSHCQEIPQGASSHREVRHLRSLYLPLYLRFPDHPADHPRHDEHGFSALPLAQPVERPFLGDRLFPRRIPVRQERFPFR